MSDVPTYPRGRRPKRRLAGARGRWTLAATLAATLALAAAPGALSAQQPDTARISASWSDAYIGDVLLAFADFSGRSIVMGSEVDGFVTATIQAQRWDVALDAILRSMGLVAFEEESGIIRVDRMLTLAEREATEPILTRMYRIRYTPAAELQGTLAPLLSTRGSISVAASTNTIVVTDIARVHEVIERLLR